ncbi:hypothetical protein [Chromobacterium phragmitis]|uniref:Uncharacterized protein n=1 Tax=Chromobacterium phragmitis TaxID=2202141 RepID=A0ABV0ITH5_9NEIS
MNLSSALPPIHRADSEWALLIVNSNFFQLLGVVFCAVALSNAPNEKAAWDARAALSFRIIMLVAQSNALSPSAVVCHRVPMLR